MEDCKKLLADGFGFVSCCRVDMTFYMDLAAVAARLDVDSRTMTQPQRELLRSSWKDLLNTLDSAYSSDAP